MKIIFLEAQIKRGIGIQVSEQTSRKPAVEKTQREKKMAYSEGAVPGEKTPT